MNLRSSLSIAAAVCVVLALSGCRMLIPDHERPEAPVLADWPSGIETRVGDQAEPSAARLPWQQFFVDEQLQLFISTSLENNRDLRVASLNVERAQAQFRIQRAAQWPTLNAMLQSQRQGPNSLSNSAMIGVGVTSYELDFFGRIQSLKEAALAQYLATAESHSTTQISLISSVATAYFSVLANNDLLKITQETLKTRGDSFKLIQLKFDNGVASELDLRQAEELYESARASLAQIRRQLAQSVNTLVLLLGQPDLPESLGGKGLAGQNALLTAIPVGLPSDLLINRPDIRSSEQQLIAANANIGAARAAFFPRIVLTGTLGRASSSLSNLFDSEGGRAWTFLPSISLPIFDAGSNRANLDVAKADQQIAVAQYEKAIQTAFSEVADALAGTATWEEQLMATRAQVAAAGKTYELSDARYQNGVSSYLDVLDAQRTLFAAQQTLIQVQLAQLQNQITLYKVLGGGWQE